MLAFSAAISCVWEMCGSLTFRVGPIYQLSFIYFDWFCLLVFCTFSIMFHRLVLFVLFLVLLSARKNSKERLLSIVIHFLFPFPCRSYFTVLLTTWLIFASFCIRLSNYHLFPSFIAFGVGVCVFGVGGAVCICACMRQSGGRANLSLVGVNVATMCHCLSFSGSFCLPFFSVY